MHLQTAREVLAICRKKGKKKVSSKSAGDTQYTLHAGHNASSTSSSSWKNKKLRSLLARKLHAYNSVEIFVSIFLYIPSQTNPSLHSSQLTYHSPKLIQVHTQEQFEAKLLILVWAFLSLYSPNLSGTSKFTGRSSISFSDTSTF